MSLTLSIQGSGAAPDGVPQRTQMTGGALTLGRGAENDIKLPDPERHLSKRHCVIEERSGVYVLIDVSTNGTFLNYSKEPVAGESPPLGDGDIVALGPYEFRVEIAETGAVAGGAADPFADLPPPLEDAPLDPAPKGGQDFVGTLDDPGASLNDGGDDILAPFGDAPKGELAGSDPFAQGGGASVLPEDDAFLRDLGALAPAPDESHKGASISDHGRSEADVFETAATTRTTIPDDWDLNGPDDSGASGEDPFAPPRPTAQPPAPEPAPQQPAPPQPAPPTPADVDPFAEEDDLLAPAPEPAAPPPTTPSPPSAPAADPFAEEDDLPPPAPAPEARIETTQPPEPEPIPQAQPAAPAPAPAATAPAAPVTAATPVSGDAARAFLQAAGVAEDLIGDEELVDVMRNSGAAFRAMVEGLREVLMTRSSIKGEFRMNQTMIQSGGNNALKFSISGEHAVKALLKPDVAGYLSAEDSVRQGLDDVKAHEVAMVTGMQAALESLIKRFDPGSLEKRMAKSASGIGAVFRGGKKATYWDAFTQLYDDIATEAEDDFQALFGKAFAKAYEEQLRSLEGERK